MKITKKIAFPCLITVMSVCGLIACNNSDNKTSETKTGGDSSMNAGGTSAGDNNAKDSNSSRIAGTPRKKGKASVTMPDGRSDKMTDKIVKDNEGVYNRVQEMPVYPGGQNALAGYVNDHLDYPQQAIDNNTSGTVKVSFVVDEKGKVIKAHLTGEKLGSGLDEQALKVVSAMPTWIPGKMNGKKVKTRLELPITFQLES